MSKAPSILIVAGEASGDLHGANLVKAMDRLQPDLSYYGMGGEDLGEAGVELLFDARKVSVVGIFEIFSHLGDILAAQKVLKNHLAQQRPDLLVIIDFPDFNLLLAKKAKQLGIPVFYYICPQIWAWRSGRARTIADRVDKAGVILPFEEKFLRERGVDATYVGHPLLDTVRPETGPSEFLERFDIQADSKCIGLLPGSRKKEIALLLPIYLEAALLLQEQTDERLVFLIPRASTISEQDLRDHGLGSYSALLDIRIVAEDRYSLMAACDSVAVTSGTVTLELALLQIPMVVSYKVAPLSYRIGRALVHLQHFSLVNLIAGKEVVPELLQDQVTAEAIAEHLHALTFDSERRDEMQKGLAEVCGMLGEQGASERAAKLALATISDRVTNE